MRIAPKAIEFLCFGPLALARWGLEKITGRKVNGFVFYGTSAAALLVGVAANDAFSGEPAAPPEKHSVAPSPLSQSYAALNKDVVTTYASADMTAADISSVTNLPAEIQEDMKRDALAAGFYRASVKTTLYPDNNAKLQPILTFGAGDCMKVHGAPSSTGLIAVSVQPWKSQPATHGWVRRSDLEPQPTLDCK